MPSVVGYWKIRGFAQSIRLLLAYVQEEFEDEYYVVGPAPDFSKDVWRKKQHTMGLDFPNLPYYMDGKVKISQSHTIMKYISRKYNLCPDATPEEQLRIDLMDEEIKDFRLAFGTICYVPNWKELSVPYLEKQLPEKLKQFEDFLGDRSWFAGEKISFVDFAFYEYLDMHLLMGPKCVDNFPRLKAFLARVEDIPQIKKYMKSDRFLKYPIWNGQAFFGN